MPHEMRDLTDHTCRCCGALMIRVFRSCCYKDSLLWCEKCGSIEWGSVEHPQALSVPERFREREREQGRYTQHTPTWSRER